MQSEKTYSNARELLISQIFGLHYQIAHYTPHGKEAKESEASVLQTVIKQRQMHG